jgi:hypothetical protein
MEAKSTPAEDRAVPVYEPPALQVLGSVHELTGSDKVVRRQRPQLRRHADRAPFVQLSLRTRD